MFITDCTSCCINNQAIFDSYTSDSDFYENYIELSPTSPYMHNLISIRRHGQTASDQGVEPQCPQNKCWDLCMQRCITSNNQILHGEIRGKFIIRVDHAAALAKIFVWLFVRGQDSGYISYLCWSFLNVTVKECRTAVVRATQQVNGKWQFWGIRNSVTPEPID